MIKAGLKCSVMAQNTIKQNIEKIKDVPEVQLWLP